MRLNEMGTATMPRKKPQTGEKQVDDRSGRKTAPVQVEKELARMIGVIAAHRQKTITELVSPLIRQWVRTNYALVQKEMGREVQQMNDEETQ